MLLSSSTYPCFVIQPTDTETYTLSLHDALPISGQAAPRWPAAQPAGRRPRAGRPRGPRGRECPRRHPPRRQALRSEEHTSELQSRLHLVCRLLLEKKKHEEYSTANSHRSLVVDS